MYATFAEELATIFRQDVVDPLEGVSESEPDSECLWSNSEVYRYMTAAFDKILRKTDGQYKILPLVVTAASPMVALPISVLEIRSAYLVTAARQIHPMNLNSRSGSPRRDYGILIPNGSPAYDTATGTPCSYMRDYYRNALRLSPIPLLSDTLELQCTVTLSTMLMDGMLLPLREGPDLALALMWMKHLAYAKQDADTLDLARSAQFEAQFDEAALERYNEHLNQRRKAGTVRPSW